MGFYREQLLPRLVDRACSAPGVAQWRAQVVEGLRGRVVEIGFGSGLNLEHLGDAVEVVLAVEPAAVATRLAQRRILESGLHVEHVGTDGENLPIADASCDGALSSFTLCTVASPEAVLGEIFRVLRPGGTLHVLEHGLSPDQRVAAWQRRLDPLQQRVAAGCHLTRDPAKLVVDAGFRLVRLEQDYARGPRPWSYFTLGVAEKPDPTARTN